MVERKEKESSPLMMFMHGREAARDLDETCLLFRIQATLQYRKVGCLAEGVLPEYCRRQYRDSGEHLIRHGLVHRLTVRKAIFLHLFGRKEGVHEHFYLIELFTHQQSM